MKTVFIMRGVLNLTPHPYFLQGSMTYQSNSKINISKNYITIQGWMISDFGLKGNSLLIYAIIYGFSQAENCKFTGSLNYLATWTNSTKQGVIKSLKTLQEKGLINKEESFSNGVKNVKYYTTKFNGGIKQSLMGGIKQSLPNNIEYNNIDNNIEYKQEIILPPFIDKNIWKEYLDMRKKLKAFNTETALNRILKKLETFEKQNIGNGTLSIENSIENGWKGVFEPKQQNTIKNNSENSFDRVLKEIQSDQFKLK